MLDEIDRAYFALRLRYALEGARDASDEQAARSYKELATEYQRELDMLGSSAAISQVDSLSSRNAKIAPRSTRIAADVSS